MLKNLIFITAVATSPIIAQYAYDEILFVPWGIEDSTIQIKDIPGFRMGPTSFSVVGQDVTIIDPIAKIQKIFKHTKLVKTEPLKQSRILQPPEKDAQGTVVRNNDHPLQITGKDFSFSIIQSSVIGSGNYLGKNAEGFHYIYVETITKQIPLDVKRSIGLYNSHGVAHAIFEIPNVDFTHIENPFYIDSAGNLFIMNTRESGVTINGWIQNGKEYENIPIYSFPDYLWEGIHYNKSPNLFPEPEPPQEDDRESIIYPQVTPTEALAMADAYVSYSWDAVAENITGGPITDPNGVTVETPSWIQVGTNYHAPYQWGGFYTLDGFNNGISNGKYAGDNATSCSVNYCVSDYAVGVDCSGFVSRCWNLSSHYSTAMMDDDITIAYTNWNDLGPGDAIHKVGHVRMVILRNTDGTYLTVEASAADWKVSYRTYNLSQLTAYTPRYYVGMEGNPATIPRTDIHSVVWTDSIALQWNIQDPESIFGFHIYTQNGGDLWNILNEMSSDKSYLTLSNENEVPAFYKITSVSANDSITESFSSDIYGTFQSGESGNILIVDGFDRTNGSYALPYHNFSKRMGLAIQPWGYSFDTADNDAIISDSVNLNNYTAVFWLLGDESTEHETFNAVEQNKVKDYLSQGGQIFISGSEVAWDLDEQGSSSDRSFIHDYLKTDYNVDDANSYTVHGAESTVFNGLTLHYDNGNYGVYPENYPDAFSLMGGSESALLYANGLIAATQFIGPVPGSQENARVVLMGFPFETIYNDQEKINLAGRILSFFGFNVQLTNDTPNMQPKQFSLYPNFPNPFNPTTTIRFDIPVGARHDSPLQLNIYDIAGRLVATLVDGWLNPGIHEIQWNGSKQASGVYFVEMVSGSFRVVQKMMLLK